MERDKELVRTKDLQQGDIEDLSQILTEKSGLESREVFHVPLWVWKRLKKGPILEFEHTLRVAQISQRTHQGSTISRSRRHQCHWIHASRDNTLTSRAGRFLSHKTCPSTSGRSRVSLLHSLFLPVQVIVRLALRVDVLVLTRDECEVHCFGLARSSWCNFS